MLGSEYSPRIRVITQPAQSPDLNINDLAFFRALGCAVRKRRRGNMGYDVDALAVDVKEAWMDYPEDKISRMWDHLDYIYKSILDFEGGNLYPEHKVEYEKF